MEISFLDLIVNSHHCSVCCLHCVYYGVNFVPVDHRNVNRFGGVKIASLIILRRRCEQPFVGKLSVHSCPKSRNPGLISEDHLGQPMGLFGPIQCLENKMTK